MPLIQRASLPQEFFEVTTAKLLTQPEPQYVHCLLIKMAMNAALDLDAGLANPGRKPIGASGADYADVASGRLVLSDPVYGEAVTFVNELGRTPGHTVRINRPKYTDSTYTLASREISVGKTISTTPLDLSSEQAAITLKRLGGPYGSSEVQPYGVDRFDASLALHKLEALVGHHLKRDFDKALDKWGVDLFDTAANTVRPEGMSADNDSAVAGDFPMDFNTVSRAELKMDELNLPVFANGRRVLILHPRQHQQLKDDSQWGRYVQYHRDVNPIFTSYVGSVGKFDVFTSNTLTKKANSSSIDIFYAQALAPGGVGCGMSGLPYVTKSNSDNYGEEALVVWLWYAGFAVLDNRFQVSVRTS